MTGRHSAVAEPDAAGIPGLAGWPDSPREPRTRQPLVPWEACHPIWVPVALNSTGTIDLADQQGPKDGYYWALRKVSAFGAGLTSISATLYKNEVGGEQVGQIPAPGAVLWSSTQEMLAPRDRLIVVVNGIGGTGQMVIRADEIEVAWLPEYMM